MRDSNPRKRSQSPVCYRYTNPLWLPLILYPFFRDCQALKWIPDKFCGGWNLIMLDESPNNSSHRKIEIWRAGPAANGAPGWYIIRDSWVQPGNDFAQYNHCPAIVGAAASRPCSTGFRIGMHPSEFIQRFDLNVGEALSLPPS